MASFGERMLGAARLQAATYEEVEADTSATGQALAVVVLSATAAGLGLLPFGVGMLLQVLVASALGWAIWAGLVWLIGTKLLPEPQTQADWGQIARTTGFAQSPGLLRVFGFIPVLGPILVLAVTVWMLVAMIVAVRAALDYRQTWRTVLVVGIGWVVNLLIMMAIGGLR